MELFGAKRPSFVRPKDAPQAVPQFSLVLNLLKIEEAESQ